MTATKTDARQFLAVLAKRAIAAENLTEEDWEHLFALAQQHELAPVMYARLKERGLTPPPAIAKNLRQAYFASAARNTRLFHELDTILRALQAAGIPVIPLKGACLAEAVYGNIALRPMADLDLWVERQQLDGARAVMRSLGYTSHSSAARPLALQNALMGETQMFKDPGLLVELHTIVFRGEWVRHTTRIDEDVIRHRTVPLEAHGVGQLAPEDAVIQSCVHLAVSNQMSGVGLRTLLDLHLARQKWVIDWRIVAERARAWRVSCATWLVLQALAEVFGDSDNQLPLADLAPSSFRQRVLKRTAFARLLVGGWELNRGPRRFLFLLALVDRPVDALVLVWRTLFPDRFWLTLRYGLPNAPSWRVWQLRARHIAHLASSGEI